MYCQTLGGRGVGRLPEGRVAGKSTSTSKPLSRLGAFDGDSGELNVVIETPQGSRNKYTYDEGRGLFKLGGVLPAGAVFPFDFGFVPATVGGDGDPLDVLVLMDEPAFAGCLVGARLLGVVEAEQTERDGETTRNDRLIAVASESRDHAGVRSLDALGPNLLAEIEHFFVSYNEIKGKEFRVLGRHGSRRARAVVEEGVRRRRQRRGSKKR
ncbi:MAG: inorganic diphosphatase [Acidobacteria bacterium]|nr:inorganic diphosphatase [Acidobacteriota bacterium]